MTVFPRHAPRIVHFASHGGACLRIALRMETFIKGPCSLDLYPFTDKFDMGPLPLPFLIAIVILIGVSFLPSLGRPMGRSKSSMFVGLGTVVRLIYPPPPRKQLPPQLHIAQHSSRIDQLNLDLCAAMSSYVELCAVKPRFPTISAFQRFSVSACAQGLLVLPSVRTLGRLSGRLQD